MGQTLCPLVKPARGVVALQELENFATIQLKSGKKGQICMLNLDQINPVCSLTWFTVELKPTFNSNYITGNAGSITS